MDMHFDGTANASFSTVTLRISPEQIDIGGLFHDNKWPDESPIHELADAESITESGLTDPAAYTTGDEKPQKKKPKTGLQQPTIMLPPPKGPLPELTLPPRPAPPPGGWASALMKRLAEWVATMGEATLAGIGVFIIAMLSPLDAGVANEWERKLPEEDENRYRELEARRSTGLAKGEKLSPQEEAEWQALEDRKFPVGRNGGGARNPVILTEPDPAGGSLTGRPSPVYPNDPEDTKDDIRRENESATVLANKGYHVEQLPQSGKSGQRQPDYKINGVIFDCYSPRSSNPRSVWKHMKDKVDKGQTNRIVLNLDHDNAATIE